MKLVQLIHT